MKPTNLKGEYCQDCAETLDAHQKDPKDTIVLCHECIRNLKASGDYDYIRSGQFKNEKREPTRSPDDDQGIEEQREAEKRGFVDRVRAKVKSSKGE